MKKLLISALLLAVPTINCFPYGKNTADTLVEAVQDIAESSNLPSKIITGIGKFDKASVETNLRKLQCSDKTQEEKVVLLTKLYTVASHETDKWEQKAKEGNFLTRGYYANLGISAKDVEELILSFLDAERMPQGDIKESMDAVYTAISKSDIDDVKAALRELDRKNLYGKPLEYALRGFEKAASELVQDFTQDLNLPRSFSDKAKIAGGTVLGVVGGVALVNGALGISGNLNNPNPFDIGAGLVGACALYGGLHPLLWKGFRRPEQRALLARAQEVLDHVTVRLNKIVPASAVTRQTVSYEDFENAVRASDLTSVRSMIWDLSCSYLEKDAQQDIFDRAASFASEILTKREEDMANVVTIKPLKLGGVTRRSWKDNAKVFLGGQVSLLIGVMLVRYRSKLKKNIKRLLGASAGALTAGISGYLAYEGWNRTSQKQLLENAEQIKDLLRNKAQ